MEAVEIVLSLWCAIALSIVVFSLRAMDKNAIERAERTHQALLGALIRAGGAEPRGAREAEGSVGREDGAVVDVDFSAGITHETTSGRWLQHVMGDAASRLPSARENRRLQHLRLVRPLPPALPVVDVAREDDTPAPQAQREPILPPPSTPSPLRPGRR